MPRALAWICILLLLGSCAEPPGEQVEVGKPKAEKSAKTEKRKARKKANANIPFLTNENCVEHLLAYGKGNPERFATIETSLGNIDIRLYTNTPTYRANFVMLAKGGYFDQTVFYRVVDTFMIQGGNSDTWDTQRKKREFGNYKIPQEYVKENFHKRGAVSAARSYTNNPSKLSSPFVFFIVQRGPILEQGMRWMETEEGKSYTAEARAHYIKYGGTPGLDGEHTVFGEVIKGMDVVDKIAKVETDGKDWPLEDVWMKVRVY